MEESAKIYEHPKRPGGHRFYYRADYQGVDYKGRYCYHAVFDTDYGIQATPDELREVLDVPTLQGIAYYINKRK